MADFSANVTTLPSPTGAGAQVIDPVQTPNIGPSPVVGIVGSIVDVFAKGLETDRKAAAEARKNNIVSGYVNAETTINNAVATGQMSPSQAAARSRANFNQYAAGYAEYIGEFEAAGKALRGFTEKGEVESEIQLAKDIRKKDIEQAQNRGFTFLPGMTPQAQDAQIEASKTGIRAEQTMDTFIKQQNELRAQGNYDQAVSEREAKNLSSRLINDITGSNLQAFQQFSATLGDQVRTGKLKPEQAKTLLGERFSNISAAIQAGAGLNPELAGPYRTLFQEMYTVGQALINPETQANEAQAQFNTIMARAKTIAVTSNPRVMAAAVTNALLPGSIDVALATSGVAQEAFNLIAVTPIGTSDYIPQVVGNPEVESDVLKTLKKSLDGLKGPKVTDKELASVQASNSINHILKQTGDFLDRGATPEKLKDLASFFASPEYASFVRDGIIDRQAATTAKKTLQIVYEPTLIKGVQQKLDEFLYGQASFSRNANKPEPKSISEVVNVNFTGSGIVFAPKEISLDPVEARSQKDAVKNLQSSQAAINQLIHIGAHMEGTTDYAAYWENRKHIFMPQVYSKYSNLDIGDVKNNMRYKGGDARNPKSWEEVK